MRGRARIPFQDGDSPELALIPRLEVSSGSGWWKKEPSSRPLTCTFITLYCCTTKHPASRATYQDPAPIPCPSSRRIEIRGTERQSARVSIGPSPLHRRSIPNTFPSSRSSRNYSGRSRCNGENCFAIDALDARLSVAEE